MKLLTNLGLIEWNISFLTNLLWRFIQVYSKSGITFIIFFFTAKTLNSYDFGIYNYILTIVLFLITIADFGISTATSKYVAEYNGNAKGKIIFFNALFLITTVSLLTTIIFYAYSLLTHFDKFSYIKVIIPLIFLIPVSSLYDGIFRGLGMFKKLSIISTCVGLLSLPIIYLLIQSYGLIGALVSQDIFYLLLVTVLAITYTDFSFKLNKDLITKIAHYSFVIGIANLGFFLFSRTDILILGHFGYISEIGYYEYVNKIFAVFYLPFSIIAQVIAPNITRLFVENKHKEILTKYKRYMMSIFLFSSILLLGILIVSPYAINLVSNTNMDKNLIIKILYLLSVIFISQSMSAVAAVGFSTSTGYASLNMYFLIIFGIINVPLTYFLVKDFGFIGAVITTLFIKVTSDILFMFFYYIKIKKYA